MLEWVITDMLKYFDIWKESLESWSKADCVKTFLIVWKYNRPLLRPLSIVLEHSFPQHGLLSFISYWAGFHLSVMS